MCPRVSPRVPACPWCLRSRCPSTGAQQVTPAVSACAGPLRGVPGTAAVLVPVSHAAGGCGDFSPGLGTLDWEPGASWDPSLLRGELCGRVRPRVWSGRPTGVGPARPASLPVPQARGGTSACPQGRAAGQRTRGGSRVAVPQVRLSWCGPEGVSAACTCPATLTGGAGRRPCLSTDRTESVTVSP